MRLNYPTCEYLCIKKTGFINITNSMTKENRVLFSQLKIYVLVSPSTYKSAQIFFFPIPFHGVSGDTSIQSSNWIPHNEKYNALAHHLFYCFTNLSFALLP